MKLLAQDEELSWCFSTRHPGAPRQPSPPSPLCYMILTLGGCECWQAWHLRGVVSPREQSQALGRAGGQDGLPGGPGASQPGAGSLQLFSRHRGQNPRLSQTLKRGISICARVPVMPPALSATGAAKGGETFCHRPRARNSPPATLTAWIPFSCFTETGPSLA